MRIALAIAAALLLSLPAAAREEPAAGQGDDESAQADSLTNLEEIAVIGDVLWMRTYGGRIGRVPLKGGEPLFFISDAVDMQPSGEDMLVLRKSDPGPIYEIDALRGTILSPVTELKLGADDEPRAMAAGGGQVAVLTWRGLYRGPVGGPLTFVEVAPDESEMGFGTVSAALTADGATLYIGVTRGEWGGTFRRIDLQSGKAQTLAGRKGRFCPWDPQQLDGCGGVLAGAVNALLPDPGRADCVIAAGGSSHMGIVHGELTRVCPNGYETLFSRRVTDSPWKSKTDTEPFFALSPATGGGWWAASDRSLVRFDARGRAKRQAMPDIRPFGRLFAGKVPGLLVVATDAQRRSAVMPGSPLIAAVR